MCFNVGAMKCVFVVASVLSGLFGGVNPYTYRNLTCGVDKSKTSVVYEGVADIETYPWMGTLYYQIINHKMTTAVILVSKQIALGPAYEIDKLPKEDIRERSRVVLGRKCGGPSIRIRDYTFHPDYRRNTYSALAMIQLETDQIQQELMPICSPPTFFINPEFYAMTASKSCKKGMIQIRKMKYVNKDLCKQFYRKSGLDMGMFWPSHATCAHAQSGGKCLWRSGTALVVKQDGHWRLLGFGLYGPGCQSPARFMDYGMEEQWVRRSIARIGMPAITRLADNYLVLRRTMSNVQRFGPCDPEETKYEIYTDQVEIKSTVVGAKTKYNMTLIHGVEYSCVVFRATPISDSSESCEHVIPKIHLRRWCAGPPDICHDFQFLEIEFYVEMEFVYTISFSMAAYGKQAKILEPIRAMIYANKWRKRPGLYMYLRLLQLITLIHEKPIDIGYRWFFKEHVADKNMEPSLDADYILHYPKLSTTVGKS